MAPDAPRRPAGSGKAPSCLLLLLLAFSAPVLAVEPADLVKDFPRARLTLVPAHARCLHLDLYIAATDRQRSQGLMYVTAMDEFEAMYFPYPEPAFITMWMKNTYLPLDMLFVGEDGRVAGVAADTKPLSLDRISSPGPVTGVIEVNAGFAARWGLKPGDGVELSR